MKKRVAAVVVGTTALVALATGGWVALADDDTQTTSSCDVAFLELTTEREDGSTELELELTSNTPGETWDIRVEHDGEVLHEAEHVTDDEAEIDLEIRRPASERTFVVTATPDSGAPCTVTVPRD